MMFDYGLAAAVAVGLLVYLVCADPSRAVLGSDYDHQRLGSNRALLLAHPGCREAARPSSLLGADPDQRHRWRWADLIDEDRDYRGDDAVVDHGTPSCAQWVREGPSVIIIDDPSKPSDATSKPAAADSDRGISS
jgi:hypothetical protein